VTSVVFKLCIILPRNCFLKNQFSFTACRSIGHFIQKRFHPKIYNSGKWQCCLKTEKNAPGCKIHEEESRMNKPGPSGSYIVVFVIHTWNTFCNCNVIMSLIRFAWSSVQVRWLTYSVLVYAIVCLEYQAMLNNIFLNISRIMLGVGIHLVSTHWVSSRDFFNIIFSGCRWFLVQESF